MTLAKKEKENKHFTSVLMAYLILVLHVILIAGLVLMVIFFRGLVNYMIWIVLGGSLILIGSAIHFYRRMKKEGKTLHEILRSHRYGTGSVEVSFLGGLASLKIDGSDRQPTALESQFTGPLKQLEDPDKIRSEEFSELVRLLENDLITLEEYNRIKKRMFKS